MKISLFTQSLYALPLDEAIGAAADVGYRAIELACAKPHFDMQKARYDPGAVAERIAQAGLEVSALSLFNNFTDRRRLDAEVGSAEAFIRLAPVFAAQVVKLTPGPPASAEAGDEHWQCLAEAIGRLLEPAQRAGVKLAFETHMRQLTDTLAASERLLEISPPDLVGLTVDFSNLSFAREDAEEVVRRLSGRMLNTHVKNGHVDADGGWHFTALDTGLTDYSTVMPLLRSAGYDGYLTVECLGPDAATDPAGTAARDLRILKRFLEQLETNTQE